MPEIEVTINAGEDIDVIIFQDDEDIEVNINDGEQIGIDIADGDQVDVDISCEGPQGVKGDKGDDGDDGLDGNDGDDGAPGINGGNYTHTQGVASAIWTVIHNLGYYPNITVVDSTDREVIGNVDYININTIQLTFSGSLSGKAYAS